MSLGQELVETESSTSQLERTPQTASRALIAEEKPWAQNAEGQLFGVWGLGFRISASRAWALRTGSLCGMIGPVV